MTEDDLKNTSALLKGEMELDAAQAANEDELLALLAQKVAEMLETQPEYLFSMLYRMDVLEKKIRPVMDPSAPEPANWGLARLILERQKQKLETKRSVKIKPLEDMDGWEW